jgi:hypothetical protein
MKAKKEKKQKIIYIDDGRTVVDMDVEGFPWHGAKKKKKADADRPTFKEKLAIVLGAYRAYLPYFVIVAATLLIAFFVLRLWLKP